MRVFDRHPTVARLVLAPTAVLACILALGILACTGSSAEMPKAKAAAAKGSSGFGVGNWPGANWRPYSAKSPFNKKIPAKVGVHSRSRQYVNQMLQWGTPAPLVGGDAGTSWDYGHPTYWAQPTDPIYRLQPSTNWNPSISGHRIRIPTGARAALGSDGHMTVVQPDGWEYDFWRAGPVTGNGGVFRYTSGARIRINGSGLTAPRSGATAANFGNLAGIIRAPELAAGKINHALFMVIRCTAADTSFGFGTRRGGGGSAFVYPATHGGNACGPSVISPPMGARVQLVMSEKEIRSLGIPAWKRAILRALRRYGAYIGDTGGPGVGLMIESSATYTSFGRPDPLVQFGQKRRAAGDRSVQAGSDGKYLFDVSRDVNWLSKLRIVAPPKR